ncbi:MAG TPA: serine/threonine-protein kinase, partial [Thermomicrobiaceae bacterium]|nr:serine/threonine-protein kinase [Thermomicrobiaceae bacterium]
MAPESIDKYRIERELGSGTFATVWLGYDPDLDRRVAIKVLGDNWSRNKDVRDRFLEEARILWRLDDPRIVRVFDTRVTPEGQPYFVMEYADAGSLQDRIQQHIADKKFYTVTEAVTISRDIAQGLVVAHGHRIVHRDLKPSNILFSTSHVIGKGENGQPAERLLMADFGIARQLATSSGYTITAGTPYYMAPEQADPRQGQGPDERADIYSAGVILYELLTNRVPYPFDSISQIIHAQTAGDRPPIHELRPDVPDALAHAIDTALQPDPYHRYASAGEWSRALDQAVPLGTRQSQPEFTIDPEEYRRRLDEERRQQLNSGGKGGNNGSNHGGGGN